MMTFHHTAIDIDLFCTLRPCFVIRLNNSLVLRWWVEVTLGTLESMSVATCELYWMINLSLIVSL